MVEAGLRSGEMVAGAGGPKYEQLAAMSHPVSKEDQMYLICVPGSCFAHMEDVISEYIKDNVQQRKQKRNKYFITHSDNRHEGLNVSPIT